jgi:hypothetical protein
MELCRRYQLKKSEIELIKTSQELIDQKAKVKPFDERVEDFPLKKNSVAIVCLSSSENKGELLTNSMT